MFLVKMVVVGMSGSRYGITTDAKKKLDKLLTKYDITEAHHGDCIGADAQFHNECELRNIYTVVHPPDNTTLRAYCKGDKILKPKPYLVRNQDIVNASDFIFAFPSTKVEVVRSGTWSTIRYAKKVGKKIYVIYSDGVTEKM